MADQANGQVGNGQSAAATTLPQGTSQPASPPMIDAAEFERYKREAEKAKGYEPFYKAFQEAGYSKVEDAKPWLERGKRYGEKGIRPETLDSVIFGEQETEKEEPLTASGWKKLRDEERKAEELERETKAWQSSLDEELGQFAPDKIKALLGDGAHDEDVQHARYALLGKYLLEGRKPYEDGHPLAGRFGPAGKDGLASILGWHNNYRKSAETRAKAARLGAIGDAANKQTTTSTTAGNKGTEGGAADKDKDRSWQDRAHDKATAEIERRKAQRAASGR